LAHLRPGCVIESNVMWDAVKNQSRCFAFIRFDTKPSMEAVLKFKQHVIMGKIVEVRNAGVWKHSTGQSREGGQGNVQVQAGFRNFQQSQQQQVTTVKPVMRIENCPVGENPAWFNIAKQFGRTGWRAGYGSHAFGPEGWRLKSWKGAEGVEVGEQVGFSFRERRERDREAERKEIEEKYKRKGPGEGGGGKRQRVE